MVELIEGHGYELEGELLLAAWNTEFLYWRLFKDSPKRAVACYIVLGQLLFAVPRSAAIGTSTGVLWGTEFTLADLKHIDPGPDDWNKLLAPAEA